jgi:hypothetical protein
MQYPRRIGLIAADKNPFSISSFIGKYSCNFYSERRLVERRE